MTQAFSSIMDALYEALSTAEPAKLAELRNAISAYENQYQRTYNDIRRQPFARKLLDSIIEAGDEAKMELGDGLPQRAGSVITKEMQAILGPQSHGRK